MKKIGTALFMLVFILFFVGCGNSAPTQSLVGPAPTQSGAPAAMEGDSSGPNMQRNPFENMVFGRVESIVGNEIVLELGEVDTEKLQQAMHERTPGGGNGAEAAGSEQPQGTPSTGAGERTAGEGSGRQGGAAGAWAGGQRTEGGGFPNAGIDRGSGEGSANRGGMAGGGRFLSQLEIQYTGETATYLIPVGLQIGTGDYSSITAGMVLGLTLDEEKDISAVTIISN